MTPRVRAHALRPPATPRFAAALGLSLLVHFSLPLIVSGGGSRKANAPHIAPLLTVRVVPPVERSLSQSLTDGPPAVEAPREARQPRAVPTERAPVVPATPAAAEPARPAGTLREGPDLTYYAAKQLDVYPSLSSALDLKYRGKAAAEGVTGRALLLVLIDEIGTVKDVSVVEAEPANYFEDDAKGALASARFTPAYRNGRAVRSRVLIEVNYGVERGSP